MWLEMITWRPVRGQLLEQLDHLGAGHRVEAVQRLVEHQHRGLVGDRLGQLDPLAHALAVAGDPAVRRRRSARRARAPARVSSSRLARGRSRGRAGRRRRTGGRCSPLGKRVVLRAVAELAEQPLRVGRARCRSTRTVPWLGCSRPVIRFISVVLPEPFGPTRLGDARRDRQVHPVDAEHLAVELRDVVEDDLRRSRHRSLNARPRRPAPCGTSSQTQTAQNASSDSPGRARPGSSTELLDAEQAGPRRRRSCRRC